MMIDYLSKVVLIGYSGIGKSNLLSRFTGMNSSWSQNLQLVRSLQHEALMFMGKWSNPWYGTPLVRKVLCWEIEYACQNFERIPGRTVVSCMLKMGRYIEQVQDKEVPSLCKKMHCVAVKLEHITFCIILGISLGWMLQIRAAVSTVTLSELGLRWISLLGLHWLECMPSVWKIVLMKFDPMKWLDCKLCI